MLDYGCQRIVTRSPTHPLGVCVVLVARNGVTVIVSPSVPSLAPVIPSISYDAVSNTAATFRSSLLFASSHVPRVDMNNAYKPRWNKPAKQFVVR